ncbi:MAG TPA: hypothetical protein VKG62_06265 [Solirubrobacteraceae bacterium]|nr:hypothetical protein [Solirubrobacteraceae bacterium]
MSRATRLEATLLPGGRELLEVHARELPQRDDLCGAFCGALALRAAGIDGLAGGPADQDAVALAAGSIVSGAREAGTLPHGEVGRRDYRLSLPQVEDSAMSGTTAAGVIVAVEGLSDGRLAAIPLAGPWTAAALDSVFDLAAGLPHEVTLVANLATRHLWGSRPSAEQLLAYLLDGECSGPPPDWDVGHFACVVGRVRGPAGRLYALADTYPSLGTRGVHLQPGERLAAAIDRPDMPAGGVIVVVAADDRPAVRAGAAEAGLEERVWDNGTATRETLG